MRAYFQTMDMLISASHHVKMCGPKYGFRVANCSQCFPKFINFEIKIFRTYQNFKIVFLNVLSNTGGLPSLFFSAFRHPFRVDESCDLIN